MPLQGHAVEARVYAEDPARGFLPSTGTLLALQFPDGVRVDTGVEQGSAITPYYDPMIAKMIAHAPTREAALDRLAVGARNAPSRPVRTPIWRCSRRSAARAEFRAGKFDTGFIERQHGDARRRERRSRRGGVRRGASCWRATSPGSAKASTARPTRRPRPGMRPTAFSSPAPAPLTLPILVDGEPVEAHVKYGAGGPAVAVDGVAGRS